MIASNFLSLSAMRVSMSRHSNVDTQLVPEVMTKSEATKRYGAMKQYEVMKKYGEMEKHERPKKYESVKQVANEWCRN
ncbi:hypothetical protein C8R42DRAFT_691619 [Lentinula raphanica]|nr:hypothetical protein C8R42DRAFT_691619 [Lentinula raphanica]